MSFHVDALALCPHCDNAPEFTERVLPTGTHVSCRFMCSKCGFRGPGVAQRLDLPGLHHEWGRANAAKEWNLRARLPKSSEHTTPPTSKDIP